MKYAVKATPKEYEPELSHFIVFVKAKDSKQAIAFAHSVVLDYHTQDFTWEIESKNFPNPDALTDIREMTEGWWF